MAAGLKPSPKGGELQGACDWIQPIYSTRWTRLFEALARGISPWVPVIRP
jgi:hypothetical protein